LLGELHPTLMLSFWLLREAGYFRR